MAGKNGAQEKKNPTRNPWVHEGNAPCPTGGQSKEKGECHLQPPRVAEKGPRVGERKGERVWALKPGHGGGSSKGRGEPGVVDGRGTKSKVEKRGSQGGTQSPIIAEKTSGGGPGYLWSARTGEGGERGGRKRCPSPTKGCKHFFPGKWGCEKVALSVGRGGKESVSQQHGTRPSL